MKTTKQITRMKVHSVRSKQISEQCNNIIAFFQSQSYLQSQYKEDNKKKPSNTKYIHSLCNELNLSHPKCISRLIHIFTRSKESNKWKYQWAFRPKENSQFKRNSNQIENEPVRKRVANFIKHQQHFCSPEERKDVLLGR